MPVTSLIMPTDDGPVLRDYTFGVQNKIQFHCVYFLIPVIDTIHLSLNFRNTHVASYTHVHTYTPHTHHTHTDTHTH